MCGLGVFNCFDKEGNSFGKVGHSPKKEKRRHLIKKKTALLPISNGNCTGVKFSLRLVEW